MSFDSSPVKVQTQPYRWCFDRVRTYIIHFPCFTVSFVGRSENDMMSAFGERRMFTVTSEFNPAAFGETFYENISVQFTRSVINPRLTGVSAERH